MTIESEVAIQRAQVEEIPAEVSVSSGQIELWPNPNVQLKILGEAVEFSAQLFQLGGNPIHSLELGKRINQEIRSKSTTTTGKPLKKVPGKSRFKLGLYSALQEWVHKGEIEISDEDFS